MFIGRWLCNLGWHRCSPRRGSIEGRSTTFQIKPRHTQTLSYLRCQRCGEWYPGSLVLKDFRHFPSRPGDQR